jgi:uncharacterized protein (DUF58 family)
MKECQIVSLLGYTLGIVGGCAGGALGVLLSVSGGLVVLSAIEVSYSFGKDKSNE